MDVERGSVSCVGVLQSVSEGTQRSGRLPHSLLLPLDKLFSVDKTGLVGRSEPEAAEVEGCTMLNDCKKNCQ